MKILLSGIQGSGKTTQAKLLAQKLGVPLISAGHILRDFARNNTAESHAIDQELKSGDLVDNNIIGKLLRERLVLKDCKRGFMLDGYPRSLDQLEVFDPEVDLVFDLKISDDLAKKRLVERDREDDKPELIDRRLNWFHQETQKVLDYYQRRGILVEIDGNQSIEEVAEDVWDQVKGRGKLS